MFSLPQVFAPAPAEEPDTSTSPITYASDPSPTAAADPESILAPISQAIIDIVAIGKPDKPPAQESVGGSSYFVSPLVWTPPSYSYGRQQSAGMSSGVKIAIAGAAALALILFATRE